MRLQVICRKEADLPRDHIVTTFYLVHTLPEGLFGFQGPAFDELAVAARAVFQSRSGIPSGYGHEVKLYRMEDSEPREPVGSASWQLSQGAQGDSGPRETACCLSFFSERNLPRQRGRMYIGPWRSSACVERPELTTRQNVAAIALGIGNIGGVNIDWNIRSRVDGVYRKVTNAFCDDEWDTIRKRGLRGTTRIGVTLEE